MQNVFTVYEAIEGYKKQSFYLKNKQIIYKLTITSSPFIVSAKTSSCCFFIAICIWEWIYLIKLLKIDALAIFFVIFVYNDKKITRWKPAKTISTWM